LSIETSSEACSVALSKGEEVLSELVITEPQQQAGQLAPLIDRILSEASLTVADLDAIAVSEGPGSYTGLRVGASTAKGLCFGAKKPLIAVSTMDILFAQTQGLKYDYVVPAIDARRMEIYQAVYNSEGKRITPQEPKIVDENSYGDILSKGKVLFVGTGAVKMAEVISSENAAFMQCTPFASAMAGYAARAFAGNDFADVAYFEPFYLKDFAPGVTKKDPLKW
ncbi:MAG: tRNA (adenosine(37)-N6)-threonylcarbamoyltransferase complex dimerization subunit type 1 TsaB, partial [Bacteroidales bacterium]|nr:tRNA (adenosine(37)-N6)-threonylcarbamoyltransferase complex dimerization subunit type 1 TsaB [Bacteroidales bacterium]